MNIEINLKTDNKIICNESDSVDILLDTRHVTQDILSCELPIVSTSIFEGRILKGYQNFVQVIAISVLKVSFLFGRGNIKKAFLTATSNVNYEFLIGEDADRFNNSTLTRNSEKSEYIKYCNFLRRGFLYVFKCVQIFI